MERQADGVGVSHTGGFGAWTPVANAGTGADSPVSSALPAVAVQLRRPPGRGQTVPIRVLRLGRSTTRTGVPHWPSGSDL
jgi:hypothetical protein